MGSQKAPLVDSYGTIRTVRGNEGQAYMEICCSSQATEVCSYTLFSSKRSVSVSISLVPMQASSSELA